MKFSVIVPTYNRAHLLKRALDSADLFCSHSADSEVIIIDDCSTDGTVAFVKREYEAQIRSGRFKLIMRESNAGVTAARNQGASAASGEWLICMDSDDEFAGGAVLAIDESTSRYNRVPIIFMRCELPDGSRLGEIREEGYIDLRTLLRQGTPGECLPVIRRTTFLACPYDADLRGFESLCYFRIVSRFGPGVISSGVARIYHPEGSDRLSLRRALWGRACLLARGNWRVLVEFSRDTGLERAFFIAVRVAYYSLICAILSARSLFRLSRPHLGE
jgi:glycosyltransferase involved in cell wall biosynthesis